MTFSHLWQYVAEFFLEWEIFYIKVVEKIKIHISCSVTFFRKSWRLWDNVEKCGVARETKNHDTIWRIRVACWISKATCARAWTRPRARAPIRTHAPTFPRARARRQICNTACPFPERASLLRYTYIACLVSYAVEHNYVFRPFMTTIGPSTQRFKDIYTFTIWLHSGGPHRFIEFF
jgi:hypothetical protein